MVNGREEEDLLDRFEIYLFPYLIYIKNNTMHKFEGNRDIGTLTNFITNTY